MANEKKRILQCFHLLTQQEDYIRSFELAKAVGVTERTIKSDIKELEQFALASGAVLESKKGKGYRLKLVDQQIFDPVKAQLAYRFEVIGSSDLIQSRTNDILRRIIVEDEYLTIDELADELYLTRSSIRDEIRQVHETLERFNLSFKKHFEEGPLIQGSEFDRRCLMLSIFENHYHEAMTFFKNTDYLDWFAWEQESRYEIRHEFLRLLRESDCAVGDDHTQRLSRYCCLMMNRYRAGYMITLTDEQRTIIRTYPQTKVAQQLIDYLSKQAGFRVSEDEMLVFALQLVFWADLRPDVLQNDLYHKNEEVTRFLSRYFKLVQKDYGLDLSAIEGSEACLSATLIPMLIQKDYRACSHNVRNTIEHDDRLTCGAFATALADEAAWLFVEQYGLELSSYNIISLAVTLHLLFLKIPYEFKPIRALVTHASGLQATDTLAKFLNYRLGKYFETLEPYELYEMRKLAVKDYDCVIAHFPYFAYKYDWPCITVKSIPTLTEINHIYNSFVLQGVQLDSIFKSLQLDRMNVVRNFDFQDLDSFIELISFRMAKDSEVIDRLRYHLQRLAIVSVYNKVMVLFVKRDLCQQNYFDLYELSQEKWILQQLVSHIVVISVHLHKQLPLARFMHDVSYLFFHDNDHIFMTMEKNDSGALVEVVREGLRDLPISLD